MDRITAEIEQTHENIASLNLQLTQAKDPAYIERQARDRLDLAGEHDLVFVFSDEWDLASYLPYCKSLIPKIWLVF